MLVGYWIWSSQVILRFQSFIVFARLSPTSEESSCLEWLMDWLDFLNAIVLSFSIIAIHTLHSLLDHRILFSCLGTAYYYSGTSVYRNTRINCIERNPFAQECFGAYLFRWVRVTAGYATWLLPKGHYSQPLPLFVESVHHQSFCWLATVTVIAIDVALATFACREKRLLVSFSGMFIPLSVICCWVRSLDSMDSILILILARIATSTSCEPFLWIIIIWFWLSTNIRGASSYERPSWFSFSISRNVMLSSRLVDVTIHDLIVGAEN